MKEIGISQNKIVIVDDEDYEYLNQWTWHAWKSKSGKFYAVRHLPTEPLTHKHSKIYMHRVIVNAPNGMEVDHWDSDGLNNQKSNLRLATTSQNQGNRPKPLNNTSGYKGVSWNKQNKKYYSVIMFNMKQIYLGSFIDPVDAAKAYDRKALELFGEFAQLNFSILDD